MTTAAPHRHRTTLSNPTRSTGSPLAPTPLAFDEFAQIRGRPGDTFVGAPGAVIDGQGMNDYAFEAASTESSPANVTIEYLTIQHFTAPSGEGVVGQGDHDGWTIEDDLIQHNPDGAGVVIGDNDRRPEQLSSSSTASTGSTGRAVTQC